VIALVAIIRSVVVAVAGIALTGGLVRGWVLIERSRGKWRKG